MSQPEKIKKIFKERLSYLLAKGHSAFGKVAPRRPYRDDDDEGGGDASGLRLKEHPWLMETPVGAASDLTADVTVNTETEEEALERAEECSPQLQQQPKMQNALTHGHSYSAVPVPTRR